MGCLKVVWIINLKEPGSTYSHSHRLEDTQSIAVAFKAYKEYSWCVGLGVRHLPFDSSKGKPESHALKLQKQKEEEKFRCAARVQKVSFFLEFSRFCGKKRFLDQRYVDVCWRLTPKMVLCCKFAVLGFSDFTVTWHRTSWTASFQLSNEDLLLSGPGKCNEIMKDLNLS